MAESKENMMKDQVENKVPEPDCGGKKKEKPQKIRKKSSVLRRILLAVFCFLLLFSMGAYCSLMLYWEKNPVSGTVIKYVQKLFLRYDLKLETGKVNTIFPAGIKVSSFTLVPLEKYTFPEISAENLTLTFSLRKLLSGVSFPLHLQMNDGKLLFPLFPESGGEGAEDVIIIQSFFLDVEGDNGVIRIKKFCGSSQAGDFELSGTVNNFLHIVASDLGDSFNEFLWHDRSAAKGKFYSSRMKSIPENLRMYLSLCAGFLRNPERAGSPVTFLRRNGSSQRPFLKADLYMDLHDFHKCSGNFLFSLPAFTLGGHTGIEKSVLEYTLKNSVLALKRTRLLLASGGELFLEGKYDESAGNISGKLSGKCPFDEIMHFLPGEAVKKLSAVAGEKSVNEW